MRVRARHLLATAALVSTTIAAAPTAPVKDAQAPVDTALQAALTAAGVCDDLDERLCLLPFPNDHFTVLAETPTGRQVELNPLATPRTLAGKPVDTTEWNRNDGFSPGALILTYVPGLDLTATYGLDATPETGVGTANDPWAVRDEVADAIIEDPALSMAPDSPIVLLNADTGERHPFYAELDEHPETLADGDDRTLIIRPLVNLAEGERYIVALRDLVDADGNEIAPTAAFTALRDALAVPAAGDKKDCADHPGKGSGKGKGKGGDNKCVDGNGQVPFPAELDIDPADNDARYADIFTRLAATGVDTTELYLAWDFHVASAKNLAGRALAIRDDAFAKLGDTVLDDGDIEGTTTPTFEVTEWADGESDGYPMRIVRGTVTVPNYLDRPQEGVNGEAAGSAATVYDQLPEQLRDNDPFVGEGLDLADEVPVIIPQSRFFYGEALPGPMATPVVNPAKPTTEAEFVCRFRTDLAGGKAPNDPSNGTTLAKPTLYGHGLLGGMGEAEGSSTSDLRRAGHAMCGVDWIGMATEDITNVALILHDISFFPSLADRAQQGFLNFQYVGRALIHPDGLGTHEAFQVGGQSVLDTAELFYNGNSQGGIMGGALTALAVDFTKSVLGVPGMNYSTLLNRSVDWEGEFIDPSNPDIPAYASFMYNMYPDKVEQQLVFSLIQMLWDRAEANGYAAHMTTDPYPNTPAHQVILEVALGDYQVTNIAAEVEARTIGADFLGSALADGRHWERAYATGAAATPYAFSDFVVGEDGVAYAPSGSAIVYWDSGNPLPFNGNVPPADLHEDPHSDPRKDDRALLQKVTFYNTGLIVDVMHGEPYWNSVCRHGQYHPGC